MKSETIKEEENVGDKGSLTQKCPKSKVKFLKNNGFNHMKINYFCSKDTTGKVNKQMTEKNDLQRLESTKMISGMYKELQIKEKLET